MNCSYTTTVSGTVAPTLHYSSWYSSYYTTTVSGTVATTLLQYLLHYYSISYTTTVADTLLSLPMLGFVSYSNVVSNLIWQQQICLMKL